ncbi:Proton-translocating NADH-quinone oxidoreductase, chain L OS=Tsukamurella paurometabola (strain ATCC 8368 / DSM / CCUG 35730 / CIP 100753 / JCM 10117 /KCTC 9821 / NBRC 16120 / NCIMB 702349 / NCTC 13040) OX=521096 GN=Tpau_3179 PE=4 SV=1 [Tsukamurella paurometabola]|uniref:Proton-translocating NADH-quinone oxidoreductase, chain L n=1 Tax=Tsukamurella paurometabola (strain ATCC 8368 / DSM 20162 / CCUG 35730 / CIP 100753 / JCM 10117 / KCTC 9821 / NBRC 16120 / NCIMB 702349 / NCTC 13040) TaxID=521096 RepID=D5UVI4_TSUPD|nr:NADH-quinone oxidoreductase subunit L [Tsukamurella paurometabola]ADG79766.1 proton-translocating NADH-quinone oxidoreductase, chain L [Tsukamurella paurometabola DSM 20162]SUP37121.1 NADH-quinone oxidoreductase subunit L [Tsukamurella paurometabola]
MGTLLAALPLIPLAGAAVLLLGGRRTDAWGHLLGTLVAAVSFVVAAVLFAQLLGRDAGARSVSTVLYHWFSGGSLSVDLAFRLDQLSVCFALLITGVGTLIHIYSIGYMSDDPGRRRFFGYLNLFLGAMLVLVLADDLVVLYLGWEGVGLASYLLIGFWQHKPSAATAARKAFIVNRVGDMGLALAVAVTLATFGTTSFGGFLPQAAEAESSTVTWIGLLLLLAACAKSAQVPLQSWLGDAMEGPTPVSALIHAATMVTAGVYLIVRTGPLFEAAPVAQGFVLAVGAVTLLFGAVIGCAKDDIKKALAASTMSQIGYMVLAAGLGPAGYALAIAHLLAHGCFKAGLFLGAGSVMHGMNDETDMRRYGGLRSVMPITAITFGLGYLAIIGVPPLSGFYTKDGIIEAAFGRGGFWGIVLGGTMILGAGITGFYMTRVMVLTFFGTPRWREDAHPHESPRVMTAPMIVLAVGSVSAGAALMLGGRIADFLAPAVGPAPEAHHLLPAWAVTALVLAAVAIGVAFAVRVTRTVPVEAPTDISPLTRAARRDLYGDDLNEAVFMKPGQAATAALVTLEDKALDGAVGLVPEGVRGASGVLRHWQTGYARSYALTMLAGAAVLVGAVAVWVS